MKRLHIVGRSKDGKRLQLAQKKGAKFGSFEIPIGPKLLRLVEEVQAEKDAKKNPPVQARPANEGDPTGVRVLQRDGDVPAPAQLHAVPTPSPGAPAPPPPPLGLSDDIDIPIDPGEGARGAITPAAQSPAPAPPTPLFEPEPEPERPPVEAPPEPEVEAPVRIRTSRPEPTRRRPEIPSRSKLSPAEIQGLIRAGRGVRSVANMAGTPVAWVKYLAEPIQQERLGIVQQMLGARQERARLGPSSASIGESIMHNLRSKGIRNPESIFDQGFTAHRPDGREWRVRLVFDHRGTRHNATWSFDPQTREVVPLNSLATRLGWRRESTPGDDEQKPRPRSSSRSKSSSRSRSAGRRSTTRARKKTTSRTSSSRRSSGSSSRKTPRKSTRKRTGSARR